MNGLAWFLATASDVKFRDPHGPLNWPHRRQKTSPKDASYRGTLGTARYGTGDWKGAIADLDKPSAYASRMIP